MHTFGLEEKTKWLRSPITEKRLNLQPMRMLELRPYGGSRKKVKLCKTKILIGHAPNCDIYVNDPFVSPVHAELRLSECGNGYVVHDLKSRNGVFLNGVRIESAPLPGQGILRLGRSTLSWNESSIDDELLRDDWIVADPSMRLLLESIKRVARTSIPVLFLGETGTGKDVLARMLHKWSQRSGGPFVPVNGALTGGTLAESELFGHKRGSFTGADVTRLGALLSAQNGTLFLDEIADVPACAQVKLLRSLESGEVKAVGADRAVISNFRLVTATSRNIDALISSGGFRADLYFRIAGFVIHVPPLRERPKDIQAISRKIAADQGLSLDSSAEARLLSHRWPGNVRELRNFLERAIMTARSEGIPRILPDHLQGLEKTTPTLTVQEVPLTLMELERRAVLSALERNEWSRNNASEELGISRSALYRKMRRMKLRDASGREIIRPQDCE